MLATYTEDTALIKALPKAPKRAEIVAALDKNKGVRTLGDLLEYLPRRYLPPNELTDLSAVAVGDQVTAVAQVLSCSVVAMKQRAGFRVLGTITDGSGRFHLTFFTKNPRITFGLKPGRRGVFSGTVTEFNSERQLTHPQIEWLDGEDEDLSQERLDYLSSHLIPVYAETGPVTTFLVRRMVALTLDTLETVREPVPAQVRLERGLLGRRAALELVHRPGLHDDVRPGLRRMRYDEAFVLQTILGQRRQAIAALGATARVARPDGLLAAFDARLPFELTAGQREVGELLSADLARTHPMHRLLQGEVGSGKTVVALRAMLTVVDAGGQAALLAPTEVLAAQHHRSITAMLGELALGGLLGGAESGTQVALLTGSQSAPARRRSLDAVADGAAGIVVGTHALIQRHVRFADLALVVVDEQHRFGVQQRDALRDKAAVPPHVLVMTATPIPRTVAMTVFGDMETATLAELPAGRQPITTHVVDVDKPAWVQRTWARVAEEIGHGHQAYVVCPSIGEPTDDADLTSDSSDEDAGWADPGADGPDPTQPEPQDTAEPRPLASVYAVAAQLAADPAFAAVRVGILHGRLPAERKEAAMTQFARGELDVLVATTVIEVGVDVPNASTMVVMDADRFGVSQLHQLRGRVGRGGTPGLCLLLTGNPAGSARARLDAVAATTDGFELSRADLALRREGDVLGARQSGAGSSVRYLRMGHRDDEELIAMARQDAFALLEADPTLAAHPALAARVAARLDEQQAAYLERG